MERDQRDRVPDGADGADGADASSVSGVPAVPNMSSVSDVPSVSEATPERMESSERPAQAAGTVPAMDTATGSAASAASGGGATPPTAPPTTAVATATPAAPATGRKLPAVISRRNLVIAGGGIIVLGGIYGIAEKIGLLPSPRQIARKILGRDQSGGAPPSQPLGPQPLPDGPTSTPNDIVIFDGALAAGWEDYSWGDHKIPDPAVSYSGKQGLSMVPDNWSALQFHHDEVLDTAGYAYLQCYVRASSGGGQLIKVYLVDDSGNWVGDAYLSDYTEGGAIKSDGWHLVRVPLRALNGVGINTQAVVMQAASQAKQDTLYMANLRLVYLPDMTPPGLVSVSNYDLNSISFRFEQPMDPKSATTLTNYLVAAAAGTNDANFSAQHPVQPMLANYYDATRTVSITLPRAMQASGKYTVSINPVKDRFGVASKQGLQAQVQVRAQPLTLAADAAANQRAINPEIYGCSLMDHQAAKDIGVTLMRWGGNNNTRYNWKLGNAWNAGKDYYFENGDYGSNTPAEMLPSGVADEFVSGVTSLGIKALLTIPNIGWVAKDTDNDSKSINLPMVDGDVQGGPPLKPNGDAIRGYDPTDNRKRTSVASRARKGAPLQDPPDRSDKTVAQDEWVYHLVRRFGTTAQGGVRYYAMDNEPDLWGFTHADVRPAFVGYDQLRDTFLEYANAVKDVDPSALITGPVIWHPDVIFQYSPLDRGWDNFATHQDFNAHGGVPFLQWWLAELRKHDEQQGRRSLDMLDLHYYPQNGAFSDDLATAMQALRIRSTRALWDPTYTDESWLNRVVQLIPNMRKWVDANYPGTKIALSEWNWGAEGYVNGGVAVAMILGIFGREGLDMACHWGELDPNTPAGLAFRLYGNYDGAGSRFDGTSFKALTSDQDIFNGYATYTHDGAILLMLVNQTPDSDLTPQVNLANLGAAFGGATPRVARVWRYWPYQANNITRGEDITLSSASSAELSFTYTLPASSVSLLRIEVGA